MYTYENEALNPYRPPAVHHSAGIRGVKTKRETGHRHHLMDAVLSGVYCDYASEFPRQGTKYDSLHAHNFASTAGV